jgi:23S rRNA maturation mini-RNase III
VSSKCQKEFAPRIARWLKERDEDKKKRGTNKATSKKRAAKKILKKTTSAVKTKKTKE